MSERKIETYQGQTLTFVSGGVIVDWSDGDRTEYDTAKEAKRTIDRCLVLKGLA